MRLSSLCSLGVFIAVNKIRRSFIDVVSLLIQLLLFSQAVHDPERIWPA